MPEPYPSPLRRLLLAFYALFAVLFRGEVALAVERLRDARRRALGSHAPAPPPVDARPPPTPAPPAQTPPDGGARAALRLLAALQREGRLVDFVEEDVTAFTDEQIGAAARTVHAGCKRAIDEHFRLEPVYREPEGATVTVATGFDPVAVRLTGNVVGAPPFKGQLRHHGWKARDVRVPAAPELADASVVAPAEVEL